MPLKDLNELFTEEVLEQILPPQLAEAFFEALYGDPEEGAYDISLALRDYDRDRQLLTFELQLRERPGKCLACNLTYGLPQVFARHPLIDIESMVGKIETLLQGKMRCDSWELGRTRTPQDNLHTIALRIRVTEAG